MPRHYRLRYLTCAVALTGTIVLAAPSAFAATDATDFEAAVTGSTTAAEAAATDRATEAEALFGQESVAASKNENGELPDRVTTEEAGETAAATVAKTGAEEDQSTIPSAKPQSAGASQELMRDPEALFSSAPTSHQEDAEAWGDSDDSEEGSALVATKAESAPDYAAIRDGQNYSIRNDIAAQVMAATAGPVLHRVHGSWFNAPDVPEEAKSLQAEGKVLVGPSTPIYVGEKNLCTLAVAGFDQYGNKVGITAGHCGKVGDKVFSADAQGNQVAGEIVQVSQTQDASVILFAEDTEVSRSYNGVTVNEIGDAKPQVGQTVCKSGVATGTTCGPVLDAYQTHVCAMEGDSGGPLMQGDKLVGVVSGGNRSLVPFGPCRTPLQGPIHEPLISVPVTNVVAELDAIEGPGSGFSLPQ